MALSNKEFPQPVGIKRLFGPSFVILALGLGSGEVILWPYLASNYGLGIVWGALLGITFQFFINMEIERYALVKGESVFVGIAKIFKWSVYWFIISTFIGFGLPGIVAASAKVLAAVFGITNFKFIAILMLLFIGTVLSVGKTVYGMMEKITKTIILIGVPFIFILAIILSSKTDWLALFSGIVGHGNNFWFLPPGIGLATFLAAFAYSGAGGNLNLTQSIYIKEKGYG
ncbi:MAG: Nramp family divalent metal transporter, partial [Candidatus Magasanikbacteria bacterium]|nr:Nramp family divalent metal transporter [Candidatus Magasanikbacteria bacterium]